MSASTEPTGDAELLLLLGEYGLAEFCHAPDWPETRRVARAALLAYLAAHYVRRERLVPDEWDDLDATAPVKADRPANDAQVAWPRAAWLGERDGPPEDATAPLAAPSDGDISALRQRYLRGDGVTLEEVKRAEATHRDTAARGVLPRRPGDELPEDAIRRVRDGH